MVRRHVTGFDDADKLVAEDEGRYPSRAVTEKPAHVRTTNSGGLDTQESFAGRRLRLIHFPHFESIGGGVDESLHVSQSAS
jgi:hypothetical protein